MRTGTPEVPDHDLTTRARIRDAAIAAIAEGSPGQVTVRRIATAAGVSPALVIHHYGSMEQLRAECDRYVAERIRNLKAAAISEGAGLDILAAIRNSALGPLPGYLAAVLTEDSPAVAALVDEMVADAENYIEQAVAAGLMRPSDDPHGRAVVLTIWSLGSLVLHQHLRRLLGVDPTDSEFGRTPQSARYVGPVWEIYGQGLMTPEFAARAQAAAAQLAQPDQQETRRTDP